MKITKSIQIRRKLKNEIGLRQRRKILKMTELDRSMNDTQTKQRETNTTLISETQYCSESEELISNAQDLSRCCKR